MHWLQRSGSGKYAYDVRIAQSADRGATWSESSILHADRSPSEHGFVALWNAPGDSVRGACELLGLDPLYVANEGSFVAFVPAHRGDQAVAALRQHPLGREACRIGVVVADHPRTVVMRTRMGGTRIVDLLPGDQLPRIC